MISKNESRLTSSSISLGDAATQFLVNSPPDNRLKAQQEINKFVRWYGEERAFNGLTIPEIAYYAEKITSSTTELAEKLEPVKAFLAYAYKQGWTRTKLSVHLKIKKPSSKSSPLPKRQSQQTISLTSQGYADLEAELTALKEERPRIAEEIRTAASDKDFRENAPLDAAREYQGKLEARIRELESTLKRATIMDEKQVTSHKVGIGDTVVLQDLISGEQIDYTLVDAREANPTKSKISIASPIGQALLGHEKGDEIEVKAPAGIMPYRIEDIKQQ